MTPTQSISKREEKITALIMVLPATLLLGVFVMLPLGMAVYRSFFDYRVGGESIYVGFTNFRKILNNTIFFDSIRNVIRMTAVIVTAQIVLSFLFANALVRIRGRKAVIARMLIYLPYLISGIVVSVIFTLLTRYNGGIINAFLLRLSIEPIAFNNDTFWSPISIIVPTLWIGFGYFTLIMYSGLINIPREYFEAAEVDGAGFIRKTFSITIPHMKNYFILLIVTLVVVNLQMFEIPLIMTNGQPAGQTMTPVLYLIHSRANSNISDSEITAAALLIMLVILLINSTIFYLFRTRKKDAWEH